MKKQNEKIFYRMKKWKRVCVKNEMKVKIS